MHCLRNDQLPLSRRDRLDYSRDASSHLQASILHKPFPTTPHDTTPTTTTMGPHIFFRIEDEYSHARYFGEDGLFAEDADTRFDLSSYDERLFDRVERHLDWGKWDPTPFITTYCDKVVAPMEAERRVGAGKQDVRVYEIDMWRTDERR